MAEVQQRSAVTISFEGIDTSLVSFAVAQVSLAGPDSVYITAIEYDGQSYSALLKYQGGTTATVERVFGARGKLIPDSVDLSQTELAFVAPNVLDISYVEVQGHGYSGQLRHASDNRLEVAGIRRVSLPPTAAEQITTLQAESATAQVAAAQAQADAAAQREAGSAARAAAVEEIAGLQAELTRMQTVIDGLQERLSPGVPFGPERSRRPANPGNNCRS